MVGRALRSHEGKENAIILDHGGNVERLGWPQDPLPTELNMGDQSVNKDTEDNEDKKEVELKPKKCPDCNFLTEAKVFTCPNCGHLFSQRAEVEVKEGKLKELKRVKPEIKRQWYSELLYIAREKGYSEGWASHKFKAKFDQWPHKKTGITPQKPCEEVLNHVIYQQIKYAKRN